MSLRSKSIKLASELPKGHPTRRKLLAGLSKTAGSWILSERPEVGERDGATLAARFFTARSQYGWDLTDKMWDAITKAWSPGGTTHTYTDKGELRAYRYPRRVREGESWEFGLFIDWEYAGDRIVAIAKRIDFNDGKPVKSTHQAKDPEKVAVAILRSVGI